MEKQEYARDTQEFCRIGYNDACINFLLSFSEYDFDTLEKCIADVTEYNNYRGDRVSKAFAKIKHLLYRASFGREGSPVLYLHLDDYQKTPAQLQEAHKAIQSAFRYTKIDENMKQNEGHAESETVLRFWWD